MDKKVSYALHNSKLYTLEKAVDLRERYRQEGKVFVLTNGCFDLLHLGHIAYLQEAAKLGDILWVALNSSTSIRKLKGDRRPIQGDEERAYALAALECVSGVTFFSTERLTYEILQLKPDIYVKAGDYTRETLNPEELEALESIDARIQFLPFVPGYSTTKLIEKIVRAAPTF